MKLVDRMQSYSDSTDDRNRVCQTMAAWQPSALGMFVQKRRYREKRANNQPLDILSIASAGAPALLLLLTMRWRLIYGGQHPMQDMAVRFD